MTRRARIAALGVTLVLLASTSPLLHAGASVPHPWTTRDGRDTRGPLDVVSVTTGWRTVQPFSETQMYFKITTAGPWASRLFGIHNPDGVALEWGLPGYESLFIVPFWYRGRLIAPEFTRTQTYGMAHVRRPDAHSIELILPRHSWGPDVDRIRWRVFSSYRGGGCARLCIDRVPDHGVALRDVMPPQVFVTQHPTLSTDESATTSFSIGFQGDDPGNLPSGIRAWQVQGAVPGSRWRTMTSGHGDGYHTGSVTGRPGHVLRVRVRAEDGQGNRATSPPVGVLVPRDDADPGLTGDWSGEGGITSDGTDWVSVTDQDPSNPQDYMGTLHVSSIPGATFTFPFQGPATAAVVLDAASPYDGEVTTCLNGACDTEEIGGVRARYGWVWDAQEKSNTLTVTLDAGTVAIDGAGAAPSSSMDDTAQRGRIGASRGAGEIAPAGQSPRERASEDTAAALARTKSRSLNLFR